MNAIVKALVGARVEGVPAEEIRVAVGASSPPALRYSLEALERAARRAFGRQVGYAELIDRRKVRGKMQWFPGARFQELADELLDARKDEPPEDRDADT